jgi:RNA polymerase sigma-70 factor (ECF subfamily)
LSSVPPISAREQTLLRSARAGDTDAFAALVEESSPSLERLALRLVRHRHDAEDVAQDAVVTAWNKLGSFRGTAPFRTWICKILVRRALDLLRRQRPETTVTEIPTARADPLAHAAGSEIEARVHAAIDSLPPVQRATMLLRVEQNLSYEEIAYVLGSSRNAVRMNLIDARKALAKKLRDVVDLEGGRS